LKTQDWSTLYGYVLLSDQAEKDITDADSFAQKETKEAQGPQGQVILAMLKNMTFAVGDATPKDDKADVPFTATIDVGGRQNTLNLKLPLVNHRGWRLDLSSSNQGSVISVIMAAMRAGGR
jgi:hypothetical protein